MQCCRAALRKRVKVCRISKWTVKCWINASKDSGTFKLTGVPAQCIFLSTHNKSEKISVKTLSDPIFYHYSSWIYLLYGSACSVSLLIFYKPILDRQQCKHITKKTFLSILFIVYSHKKKFCLVCVCVSVMKQIYCLFWNAIKLIRPTYMYVHTKHGYYVSRTLFVFGLFMIRKKTSFCVAVISINCRKSIKNLI